jgi:hypothetical protein
MAEAIGLSKIVMLVPINTGISTGFLFSKKKLFKSIMKLFLKIKL